MDKSARKKELAERYVRDAFKNEVFARPPPGYMYPENVTVCEGEYALAVQALGTGWYRFFFREMKSGKLTTMDYWDLTADA
ncbi:hypothetical protein BOX15_Mlig002782g2 [Macrostomum lignano]|uniref:Uncharacterized protein n=1 Tax=Macrostomum lignano TaxID=282301 RepID=A0A267FCT9_9PLAT|nr:hypothetical protein BOX15_Mlig002782g2 [Macrostomum lignano]